MRQVPRLFTGMAATLGAYAAAVALSPAAWAGHEGESPNPTDAWNHTWEAVLLDLWIIGIIFAVAAIYMLIRFRATNPDAVGKARKLSLGAALGWCLVPAALFLAVDFLLSAKGWSLWNIQRTVPADAMEIKVSGTQWAFAYEYPGGVEISSADRPSDADLKSPDIMAGDMVIPVGQPVVLRMVSEDVIHSFGLTDYRLKEDMMPGRITYLWFVAKAPKVSQVVCVEFCGADHSSMFNRVVAVPRDQYDGWLKARKQEASQSGTQAGIRVAETSTSARSGRGE
jgi:cytochrome c oxidase subunit II